MGFSLRGLVNLGSECPSAPANIENGQHFSKNLICSQNTLFGIVRPRSQFVSVPKLTPSCAAKPSWVSVDLRRYSDSISASWCLFLQGGESHLTALITSWQKGFRNNPFRHIGFIQ